jgi:ABC-type proline/glycine betaine transport system ATPase subunit
MKTSLATTIQASSTTYGHSNMNVQINNGEIMVDKFDMIMGLLGAGFTIAMVVIVIVAAVRIGWAIAPWVLGLGFLAWLLF